MSEYDERHLSDALTAADIVRRSGISRLIIRVTRSGVEHTLNVEQVGDEISVTRTYDEPLHAE